MRLCVCVCVPRSTATRGVCVCVYARARVRACVSYLRSRAPAEHWGASVHAGSPPRRPNNPHLRRAASGTAAAGLLPSTGVCAAGGSARCDRNAPPWAPGSPVTRRLPSAVSRRLPQTGVRQLGRSIRRHVARARDVTALKRL